MLAVSHVIQSDTVYMSARPLTGTALIHIKEAGFRAAAVKHYSLAHCVNVHSNSVPAVVETFVLTMLAVNIHAPTL